ncbi:pyrrolo-quinoline quinone [Pacificimonas flava]|uniref:Pyrrolo-quinoline quinone n=2 Tax=Pacificimonas TaxID=1960290 RepID=A0A219B5A4_9SPHN|nr:MULTISPECIES: PQQ-like beta-propeller repeat protein [Pacificimonas]MBZ6379335.1 PQQ-binding-like beta-propeller repeat protein [Pacificimonas aurantium]OWV33461.1 pyrrolo-quinoline quinone [Pacificimonas flava]
MTRALSLLTLIFLAGCGLFGGDEARTPTVGNRVAVLPGESRVEADPDLRGQPVVLPPSIPNAEWTQPGGEAAKSLGHVFVPVSPERRWDVQIGEASTKNAYYGAPPVVSGGRIFAMDTVSRISAFDAHSGRSLWSSVLRPEEEDRRVAFGGGVSALGGRVYATSGYGLVAAYDAETGSEIWRRDLELPLRGAPTVAENRVFAMTLDNQMIALDADTGEREWEVIGTVEATGLLGAGSPAVLRDTAVVGFSSGELTAARVENGRTVWQDLIARTGRTTALTALSDIDASPVIDDDGNVIAFGHGGRLVSIRLTGGQRQWEQTLGGVSTPWVAGDWVFTVSTLGELAAVQKSDGRIRWITQLPRWRDMKDQKGPIYYRGPVLAGGRLWLTNSEGELLTVDPAEGEVESRRRVGKRFYLPPIVAGETLYLLDESGRLSAWR